MSDLKTQFDAAMQQSKSLPKQRPDVQLDLYGLFKQASTGDVGGKRPGPFDIRGRAKWDAWKTRKGMSNDDAMTKYIAYVEKLAG
ncbi:MAG: diazepam-binding inhibitor (GABA receptor modulating acyl-CoA-binding protein) [Myxococcota bacterium]|jgi:diazepam-binding inhibitor (GABA receptor modulating acyl-CoA-binding protein)